ncbi:MAG TPA: carbohydrate ABC transporter permease [Bacillales bacterium]|nr:carbohydrate ABC transporter permease [Bacillales bacterium]
MMSQKARRLTIGERLQNGLFSSKVSRMLVYICLSLWSATTILPLLWVINNSFKTSEEVVENSFSPALNPTLANYQHAFDLVNIGDSYLNSLIMAGGAVIFTLLFGGMAAFVMARFSFRVRGVIQAVMVMSLLIPPFATVVPLFIMFSDWGLVNTYWALIIPATAGNLPFAVFVMSAYMATIPKELEEASIMDGCSRFKMYTKIFFPISKPVFATVSVFVFLWTYNDLFSSLIFVRGEEVQPIVVLLNMISTKYGTDYGLLAVAVVMTAIPVICVYILLQKYIEKGLTTGAVKG